MFTMTGRPLYRTMLVAGSMLLGLTLVITVVGCGGTGSGVDGATAVYASDVPEEDPSGEVLGPEMFEAPAAVEEAMDQAAAGGPKLLVRLSRQLDGKGNVKAWTIRKAELLDTRGRLVRNGTIAAGIARFPTGRIGAGTYFVRINDLDRYLVPTRIDNPLVTTRQFVGKKLRTSVIGSLTDPTYRIQTFPQGGSRRFVVKYTNGLKARPTRYGYAIVNLKSANQEFETGVLGRAKILATTDKGQDGPHNHTTWLLGPNNHGTSSMNCSGCHGNLNSKPAGYNQINDESGWCFQCHYGPTGPAQGPVDPTQ